MKTKTIIDIRHSLDNRKPLQIQDLLYVHKSSTPCVFSPDVKHEDKCDEKQTHNQYWNWATKEENITKSAKINQNNTQFNFYLSIAANNKECCK